MNGNKIAEEVGREYSSSLSDLVINSKPLINMLTILAEENIAHAASIVQSVEKHLEKVPPEMKLAVLYLVDSIIKNVGDAYTQLFSQIIVNMFCRVFKQVDEKTRSQMFKLRETWHDVFPSVKLYQLDVKVSLIDPAWPIQAHPPPNSIHVNPNFFKKPAGGGAVVPTPSPPPVLTPLEEAMRNEVALKEQELLLLQRKKIEMELEQTRRQLQEQRKALERTATAAQSTVSVVPSPLLSTATIPVKSKHSVPTTSITSGVGIATGKITPANSALVSHARRRDPRLSRQNNAEIVQHAPIPAPFDPYEVSSTVIAPNLFDIKPLEKPVRTGRHKSTHDVGDGHKPHNEAKHDLYQSKKDPRLDRSKNLETDRSKSKVPVFKRSRSPGRRPATLDASPFVISKRDKSSASDDVKIELNRPKLRPIPKIKSKNTDGPRIDVEVSQSSPTKRKKDQSVSPRSNGKAKKSKDASPKSGASSPGSSKPIKSLDEPKKMKIKPKYEAMELETSDSPTPLDVAFKELKTCTKGRNYIRRNREKSESPERADVDLRSEAALPLRDKTSETADRLSAIVPEGLVNGIPTKDVDLRLIPDIAPAPITRKRPSGENLEPSTVKKTKSEKFDALFGNEDVDLRTLPLAEDLTPPPAPSITSEEDADESSLSLSTDMKNVDGGWAKVKEIQSPQVVSQSAVPSNLDLVRAKLAEATKGTDRLGRPLLYNSFSDDPKEHKRKQNSEDTDMRPRGASDLDNNSSDGIKIIMTQAEEQLKAGTIDKQQYQLLLFQVLQINERQKLNEAKQKESLEASKRKLHWLQNHKEDKSEIVLTSEDDNDGSYSPFSDDGDAMRKPMAAPISSVYGDIDERVVPPVVSVQGGNLGRVEGSKRPPLLPRPDHLDSDLRMHPQISDNSRYTDMRMPVRPMYQAPRMFARGWRGGRPRLEEWNNARNLRTRGPAGPNSSWRMSQSDRPQFDQSDVGPQVPFSKMEPLVGMSQIRNPLVPYVNNSTSPHTARPSKVLPDIDLKVLEYIDQDPMRTKNIDEVPREIRFYDRTAVIMMDWDDPREISFQPGQRKIALDDVNFVLSFNEDYKNITIDGQVHRIRFGAPTRELFIDDAWFECLFGGPPTPILLNGKVRHLQLDGPPPQVTIGKDKRTDLVAGKINLIIDAAIMLPVFLDAKPQKFEIDHKIHIVRFVDSLETILINEKPFSIRFGGLPKPIFVGKCKHFIRFSMLPKDIVAGQMVIANMEGKVPDAPQIKAISDPSNVENFTAVSLPKYTSDLNVNESSVNTKDVDQNINNPKTEADSDRGGLDVLASVMPSSMAPASQFGGYSIGDTLGVILDPSKPTVIPGFDTPSEASVPQDMSVPPPNISSLFQNLNVNDLFAKLVASGIVTTPAASKNVPIKAEENTGIPSPVKIPEKSFSKSSSNIIKPVNLLKPETLKIRQPGLIAALHTGMQCGSCGVRFPPEHTVRYSQHLDWHFRQNRADRDSQRRPHSRRWHYDISDWIQYEEIEDLEEREKSWFERQQQAAESESSSAAAANLALQQQEASSVPAGTVPNDLRCELCRDSFDQFYNEESEEWHLRKAIRHEDKNYHPLCLEDYKASLAEKEAKEKEAMDVDLNNTEVESTDTANVDVDVTFEIADPDESIDKIEDVIDDIDSQDADKDNESVVEVLSEECQSEVASQEDEETPDVELVEEDDDVVIKTEPVEQIIVDDVDTDEETEREREARNNNPDIIAIDFKNVKIKQEPIDPDDEPIITAEEVLKAQADTTHASVLSSIDGNVQLEPTAQAVPVIGGIRINITKPLVSQVPKEKELVLTMDDTDASNEPLPPGEEPEIVFKVKPSLEGVEFSAQPPCNRGSELSALCSIM